MDFVPISIRSPKGGGGSGGGGGGGGGGGKSSSSSSSSKSSSKSKSGSSSKTPKIKGGSFFSSDDDGEGVYSLPLWARILIFILIIMVILFISAFIHYAIKENKRRVANKHKFRWGKVLWKAFKVATLIGVFTWLYKKIRGGKNQKPSKDTYAKIEEGQSMNNIAPADHHPSQYHPPAQKYEPMGYQGYNAAYAPSTVSSQTPPTTAYAPPTPLGTAPAQTPPPYSIPQQPPPPQQMAPPAAGASAEYYNAGAMPTPPAAASVNPMPPVQPTYQAGLYQPPPPQQTGYYQPPPQ